MSTHQSLPQRGLALLLFVPVAGVIGLTSYGTTSAIAPVPAHVSPVAAHPQPTPAPPPAVP